jgi:hypothetical protein
VIRADSPLKGGERTMKIAHTLARQHEHEAQEYMREMLRELRDMAEGQRMEVVSYLIEMAYVEVSDILRGERPMRQQKKIEAATKRQEAA